LREYTVMASYVIVTPAFNEAEYIGKTIDSVLGQSVKPQLWVIVDDGSMDRTADVVKKYASQYQWIHYVYRQKVTGQSYYGSNVYAIAEGIQHLQNLEYDFLAILDADISLPQDYYETIIRRMEQYEKLGIASGVYENLIHGKLEPVLNDRRSTPKALMVFRNKCYKEIGGFLPMKFGGEDTVACFTARMKGWKVWSFPDIKVVHHRPTGMGNVKNILTARFKQGICEYHLAMHPLFCLIKSMKRCLKEKPYLIGGFARMAGYMWAALHGQKIIIPPDVIKYIRKDQLDRIANRNRIFTMDCYDYKGVKDENMV
jgi:biofilm PGA synthesis N-glycosyltransferase PgaC